jgi:predicted O-methyltransferase YrrM
LLIFYYLFLISQDPSEFLTFIKILKERGVKEILEIGTYKGGSALLFYKLLDANVTTIDIKPHRFLEFVLNKKSKGKIRLIKGNSHDYETLKKKFQIEYTMLYLSMEITLTKG